MKNIIILLCLLSVFSCGPIYYSHLQNSRVSSPLPFSNIPVAEKEKSEVIVVRPSLTINPIKKIETQTYGHTFVNEDGIFEVEYQELNDQYIEYEGVNIHEFTQNNLTWNLPNFQLGLDIDIIPDRFVFCTGGINYCQFDKQELLGFKLGTGIHGFHENIAYRIDASLNFVQYFTQAQFVTGDSHFSSNGTRRIEFVDYSNKKYQQSPSLGLTINSQNSSWLINYYIYAAIGEYNVFYIDTETDLFYRDDFEPLEYKYKVNYSTLSMGIFKNYTDYSRILLGIKLHLFSDNLSLHKEPQIYIQNDFILK